MVESYLPAVLGLLLASTLIYGIWRRNEFLHRIATLTQAQATLSAQAAERETWQEKAEALIQDKATLQAQLTQEQTMAQEKLTLLKEAEQTFQKTFQALSAETLAQNNENFLKLAETRLKTSQEKTESALEKTHLKMHQLITPLGDALGKVQTNVAAVEKVRLTAYAGLQTQIASLIQGQQNLKAETSNLVRALRTPAIRGRWGEMQLRRVVEMSGLSPHCDFVEQAHLPSEDGARRPDMIVRLPGDKQIVVDAKVPLEGYLNAIEAKDEETREAKMLDHARQVKAHIQDLSSRAYWAEIQKVSHSPEFVVLFLPGETFFTAALEKAPDLIEEGVAKKVIIATPVTLIALLHSVAYGWRQEKLADNAREIALLGQDLYKRFMDMSAHFSKLGTDLTQTTNSYNKLVGSYERRVLPGAKKFQSLGNYTIKNAEKIPQMIDRTPKIVVDADTTDDAPMPQVQT